jgi:hypothetical protein
MRPVELAARSREELLRRTSCAGESGVEYVLYIEDRDALPNAMFVRRGDEIYRSGVRQPKSSAPGLHKAV